MGASSRWGRRGKKRGGPFPLTAMPASTAFSSVSDTGSRSGTEGVNPFGGVRDGYGATESSTGAAGNTGVVGPTAGGRCAVQLSSGCGVVGVSARVAFDLQVSVPKVERPLSCCAG
eukprot:CAMPEP_0201265218 /NCGR_PEP_ID=MMETSP0853-20130426/10599_1 /ASSEMBLY_ACC=CAM_ASM_000640 /TAXON_ID=183588 /ORGANISM="Pseudo-nitzschia fraudulenta, Strain WWA7" /LENGTH=115 /DNA_ID=CAMNT_0047569385 /DNA_START=88 /DNA_END=432 /DNA_ORIENTATION=-